MNTSSKGSSNPILLPIIVVVMGILFLTGYTKDKEKTPSDEAKEYTMSVSFSCKDKTRFMAEFSSDGSADINVDGETVRTVKRMEGDAYSFENYDFMYSFVGEGVTVLDKVTKKTTTCSQPVDVNNAPVNFGDAV